MSDVRDFDRDRAAIADAVCARVGGDCREVEAILGEMAGGFSPWLHRAATAALPQVLASAFGGRAFDDRVTIEGKLAPLAQLAQRATLVLAPTHASNLDSIVLGLVACRAGLPPLAYAAGRHIYRNPVFAALMRRLGAYKLDPDRHERLYLRVVNVYVHELLARGYHTAVFPSGTRGRSGEVESKIKLGLLGAAVQVRRPIAIVPVAINYQVVLEAEHLIAYHLAGRAHERIVGDELFAWGRLRDTARRLSQLDQRVTLRFGDPIDPHASQPQWRSQLATSLAAAYRRDTVWFSTHIVARALFDLARTELSLADVHRAIAEARARLRDQPALGQPWRGLAGASPDEVLDAALHAWASWHRSPPAIRCDKGIAIENRALLLFYRNRTAHVTW